MKYREEQGDLFTVDPKYVLAHCISQDVTATRNIMARIIEPYLRIGKAIRFSDVRVVYNLVTKEFVNQQCRWSYLLDYYENLKRCLYDLSSQMIKNNEQFLAIPKIGCGLDRADWKIVKTMIRDAFKNTDIEILVRYI